MNVKIRRAKNSEDGLWYLFWCPGCKEPHQVHISPCQMKEPDGSPHKGPHWTFDGNEEKPTFGPSILIYEMPDIGHPRCHSFVKAGRIEFCADSGHELKGQTFDLPDWPYKPGGYGGIED